MSGYSFERRVCDLDLVADILVHAQFGTAEGKLDLQEFSGFVKVPGVH